MGRARFQVLAAASFYVALGLFVHRDLVRSGLAMNVYQQNMLGQDCLLHAWTIAWGQHALATAPSTVGDANIFHPERGTLFYSDHLLALTVLTAPLRLATDDVLLVHNLLLLAAPVLDALALYALALYLTGSASAAIVGGLAYGFAPLRFSADACQIQMTAAWWLPLMLLGGMRAVRGDGARWAVLAGVALAGQGMTGIYLTAYFLPFLALAHLLWWRRDRESRRGWMIWLGAEAAAVFLLLPTGLEYHAVQQHLGAARSPFVNAILSLRSSMIDDNLPWRTLLVLAALVVLRPHDLSRRLREQRWLYLAIVVGALLFGLGPALPLPFGLGTIPGPYRLLVELPGFTALRVPARMMHVGLLGASVLAAGGVMVLRQAAWRAPLAATLIAVAALAVEHPPRTGGLLPVAPPARMNAVYPWLARHPARGAIVELPPDPYGLTTSFRQFASTLHWQRGLQGMSGVLPPVYPWITARLQGFPAADVVGDLTALGVTRAIVETHLLGPAARAAVADAERTRRVLKRRWAYATTVLYALRPHPARPAPSPSGRPLDRTAWRATASVGASQARNAIDDDPASAWRSWGDLDASVQRSWYDPLSVLERWQVFLAATPATLTIDLGAPIRASAIQLVVGGSDPMLLPELRLEASSDEIAWTPIALRPYPDARALVTRAADLPMAAVLPAPRPLRYLRLAVGAYDSHVRDVAVFTP